MIKIYLFSMEGCPHCLEMKTMLDGEGITYEVKDIDEYVDEYNEFVELVDGVEYVPAFLCIEIDDDKVVRHLAMAPDRDYQDLEEALEKVKNFING